ncbi:integumentary mucin C.1-like [Mercenaria mercenaria]|uniref:integumentary mucin C.1-like n=1 Tax=Mercenaria mercenaria TaxID=6596 RepID=UPI00234FAD8E|nr:integumentary mucin C.1-like [Mercenaria mercenaria]
MKTLIYLTTLVFSAIVYANKDNACHGHGHRCGLVDTAIQDIGINFDDHLCHAFKDVNCDGHVLEHDEQICGTDGITYSSHCSFAKTRCFRQLDKHLSPLDVAAHGPCGSSNGSTTRTSGSVLMTTVTRSASTTNTLVATTNAQVSTTSSSTIVSMENTTVAASNAPVSTTSSMPTTTTVPASATSASSTAVLSTTISTHAILGTVFCQYQGAIVCGQGLSVVCGSDGNFYPNKCELSKSQCSDPTLREVSDPLHCSLSP